MNYAGFQSLTVELMDGVAHVIIDNPPIGLVSDGIKNLTESDIPIYVFKSHYSKRNFAFRVKELFEMQQLQEIVLAIMHATRRNKANEIENITLAKRESC